MAMVRAEATADVGAPADVVYAILADYDEGHPAVLPPEHFTGLEVERGGRGAGTVIRFGVRAMGRVRESRAEISEPEPGRLLRETALDDPRGLVTEFLVEPVGAARARVTISTAWTARGLGSILEGLLAPALLRRIYVAELARIDEVARRAAAGGRPSAPDA